MLRIPFLQTITLSRRIFSKNCSPTKIARFLPLFFTDQNLELFGNNYQNRIIRRIENNLFFHAESSLRKRTFILSWTETRLLHTHTYAHVCGCPSREMSPSAPEEFNRKSIKVTRQLVVARLCTGAIVKAKPVILYIRQREPTPNQYPLWYTDVYRKRSATTAGIICDPGFVARATIEISLFNIILSARVWCLWIGGRSWNRHFVIINLLSQIRSFCVNANVGKNFRWKFLLFRFYFFFKFINFHGQHRLNNVRFVPSVWNRVKYSSWLREKNC